MANNSVDDGAASAPIEAAGASWQTITEVRGALGQGHAAATFLRQRWSELVGRNERAPDPAWISLATPLQLEAQLSELERRDPGRCPLYGVPFAVKDNIDVAGWTTTAACPEYGYVATRTAAVVQRLQDAGAVLLGKTNLDQFATGLVGTRSPYGKVPNVFDPAYVSGGSSSGSASVTARGLVSFALATDTAGSGRIPAGFNNLIGCKPTPGVVSTDGVVPACRTLDCVSTLSLTVADAATLFAILAGPGATSQYSRSARSRYALPPQPRVGVPRELFFANVAYRQLYAECRAHLSALCCEEGGFDFAPFAQVASLLYQGPWTAERYAVAGALTESGVSGVDAVVADVISTGKRYSAVDTFNALYRLRDLEAQTRSVWEEFDVLMVPTAPNLPTMAEVAAEPILRNSELGTYTNFVNLLGLCAIAVPGGFTPSGLPFGVTFIAPGGNDWALLEFAARWQRSRALPVGANLRVLLSEDTLVQGTPPQSMPLVVVGAHLSGMPLHSQLVRMGARLRAKTYTAASYRLYALANAVPPKPALVRSDDGRRVAVEVYDVPQAEVGEFLAGIAAPLGLGRVELEDGTWVNGFICEPWGLKGAQDITAYGGWRNYQAGVAAETP